MPGPVASQVMVFGAPPGPQRDAERIKYAIQGLGTDEGELIDVCARRSRAQLQETAAAYLQLTGRRMVDDLRSDTSFNFRRILVGRAKSLGDFLADEVYDAVKGAGTKERALIDIFCQITPEEKAHLVASWNQRYAKSEGSLRDRIKSETSFNFERVLLSLIERDRMPPGFVDAPRVQSDCDALYRAGEGRIGTDDRTFLEIITRGSVEHLQAISALYRGRKGRSIEDAIKKETSGDYMHSLLALATPRAAYAAERIHDAIAGLGTNDSLLCRMFLLNEAYLPEVARWYQSKYGRSLDSAVRGDTSGDYKKFLCAMLQPAPVGGNVAVVAGYR